MNEEKAKLILGDIIQEDGQLFCNDPYFSTYSQINTDKGSDEICIDGFIDFKLLIAIAWWCENKLNKKGNL
jgi:hypothetical protein